MRLILALALMLAAPAAAQAPSPLLGRPALAIVEDPGVALLVRQGSGGRQGIVARRLRHPGPPIAAAEDGWVHAWTCAPEGCGREALFIAWHEAMRRVVFLLVDEGRPTYGVPPLGAPWPRALEAPLAAFRAAVGGR